MRIFIVGFFVFVFAIAKDWETTSMLISMELVTSIQVHYVAIKNKDLSHTNVESFPKYAVKYEKQGTEQYLMIPSYKRTVYTHIRLHI